MTLTDYQPTWYVDAEVRPGHGREVSVIRMPSGSLVCGVDAAFLAAATREVMALHEATA